MLYRFLLNYLPFIILLFLIFLPAKKGAVKGLAPWLTLFFAVILVLSMAGYPVEPNTDKDLYQDRYFNTLLYGLDLGYKDVGWIVYNVVCVNLFGDKIYFFWLLTATIYVGSYYFFSLSYINKRRTLYILVMSAGLLGFSSYGVHTIRQGLAIALVLFSLSNKSNIFLRLLLLVLSLTIHKSMFILILVFVLAKYFKDIKYYGIIWIVCLFISIMNVDIQSLFENFGFIDNRVTEYGSGEDSFGEYNVGFRWDFLLYSVFPLLFSYFYVWKKNVNDEVYNFIVRAYLLANSIWILVIRMPFTDRMAYLSWFMIPFITLYPLLNYSILFKSPQKLVISIMTIFMGVHFILLLR